MGIYSGQPPPLPRFTPHPPPPGNKQINISPCLALKVRQQTWSNWPPCTHCPKNNPESPHENLTPVTDGPWMQQYKSGTETRHIPLHPLHAGQASDYFWDSAAAFNLTFVNSSFPVMNFIVILSVLYI